MRFVALIIMVWLLPYVFKLRQYMPVQFFRVRLIASLRAISLRHPIGLLLGIPTPVRFWRGAPAGCERCGRAGMVHVADHDELGYNIQWGAVHQQDAPLEALLDRGLQLFVRWILEVGAINPVCKSTPSKKLKGLALR